MKTKKQKLPPKPRTIDEITGKPGGFKKFLKKQEREAKQSEARRQQRIKAAHTFDKFVEQVKEEAIQKISSFDQSGNGRHLVEAKHAKKPAHTEVFEGYGVMMEDDHLLKDSGLVWFSFNKKALEYIQTTLSPASKVVKIRAEFKVI